EGAEDIAHVVEARLPSARADEGFVSKLVVQGALLRIAENVEGLGGFLEALDGRLVAGIPVGMVSRRRLAIGALHVLRRGIPGNAQDFVVVPLGSHRTHVESANSATV